MAIISLLTFRAFSEVPVTPDSTTQLVINRIFNENNLENFRLQSEFAYYKGLEYETNLLQRFWRSVKERLREAFGLSSSAKVNEILFYLLILISIVGILYHLLRSQSSGFWQRRSEYSHVGELLLMDESVDTNQIAKVIHEAEDLGDFRLAIRYLFALTTKKLNNSGIIDWRPEMTNMELLSVVNRKDLKQDFTKLISIFEHTWYGNYHIGDLEHYQRYRKMYNDFLSKIENVHV